MRRRIAGRASAARKPVPGQQPTGITRFSNLVRGNAAAANCARVRGGCEVVRVPRVVVVASRQCEDSVPETQMIVTDVDDIMRLRATASEDR